MSQLSKFIFVIQPFSEYYNIVFSAILEASSQLNVKVIRADQAPFPSNNEAQSIKQVIADASLVVADISHENPNVMFEIGLAQNLNIPVILIAQTASSIPSNLRHYRIIFYDLIEPIRVFVELLSKNIAFALRDNIAYAESVFKMTEQRKYVFISYCHNDKEFLLRLLVHLKPLEREGLIDTWVDTKLKAGDKWKDEISTALDKSAIGILLVSADFMASDFIIDNELPPLLRTAEEKGTTIIPVILKPCRFIRDPNLKHFQAANDPKTPLVLMSYGEREVIYDGVAQLVESLIRK